MPDLTISPGLLERHDDQRESEIDTDAIERALDGGACPFCDEYDGDHPGRHAPKAHPDQWAEYQEASA